MAERSSYWTRWEHRRLTRRRLLGSSGMLAGAGLVALTVGCGDDDDDTNGGDNTSGATATPAGQTPKRGGSITASATSTPTALDANYVRSASDTMFLRPMYDTLVRFDEKSELHPGLATSWEPADSTTWVFTLREGVMFHDGTPFNAEAAKTFLDLVRNPENGSTQQSELAPIDSIEAPNATTLRINLTAPFSPLPAALYGRAGMFVSPAAIERYGKDTATNPVGTGPFRLDDYVSGSHLRLRRNDRYWDAERPYLDEITFRILTDPETAIASFEAGDLDILTAVVPGSVDRVSGVSGTSIYENQGSSRNGFLYQTTKPPFNDENLRRAVSHAAGYEDVVQVALRGKGSIEPMNFWYPWGWAWYEDVPPITRDVDKAKEYLAKAGKADGFSFTLDQLAMPPDLDVLRANLAEVGITMNAQLLEVGDYAARNRERVWEAQYTAKSPNATMDPGVWAKRFMWTEGAFATSGIVDDEMDRLILEGEQENSVEARVPIYKEVNKKWFAQGQNDSPIFMSAYGAHKEDVNGFLLHPEGVAHVAGAWRA